MPLDKGEIIKSSDILSGTIETALSSIPGAGIYFSAVQAVKQNAMQRRFKTWQEAVERKLDELSEEVKQSLGDNEAFATVMVKATQLAAQTNAQKMEYLANALIYAAEHPLDEDRLVIYLNCLEKYTLSHILILDYFHNPTSYDNGVTYIAGSVMEYFYSKYPNFDKKLGDLIMEDLFRDGMTDTHGNGTVSAGGMMVKRTTALGEEFYNFIGGHII